jgi:hypothetical protein
MAVEAEVWDTHPVLPTAQAVDPTRIGQHGLEDVMAVAHLTMRPEPTGKRITASISLGPIRTATLPPELRDTSRRHACADGRSRRLAPPALSRRRTTRRPDIIGQSEYRITPSRNHKICTRRSRHWSVIWLRFLS